MESLQEALLPEEYSQLKDAIPLITILIAGADNDIDTNERTWAEKLTNIRSYSLPELYRPYYEEIGETFAARLDELIEELPHDVEQRSMEISRRMAPLNDILAKLSSKVAANMYSEWLTFAQHVARASGGFMKFWSISAEEKRWVGLPMLREFTYTEGDEEE